MFDYRGSGYSDLDFEEMTLQTEIEDLTQVLKYVRDEVGAEAEVCTWGMSLGTSVLAEVLKSDSARVAKTVLWGLSAELFERWHVRWQDQFDQQGYAILPSGYIVRPSVVEGMRGINTYRSLSSISIPILCVAGGADPGGELRMSKIAASECGANFKLVEYPTGMHAFKGQPDLLHEATDLTINWLDG